MHCNLPSHFPNTCKSFKNKTFLELENQIVPFNVKFNKKIGKESNF